MSGNCSLQSNINWRICAPTLDGRSSIIFTISKSLAPPSSAFKIVVVDNRVYKL
jgi:hypothetical protein